MGDYYNKMRTTVAVALGNGQSLSIPPKTWAYVSPEAENTASLVEAVNKGRLVRAAVPITVVEPQVSPVVKVATPEETGQDAVKAVVLQAEVSVESKTEEAEPKPVETRRRRGNG